MVDKWTNPTTANLRGENSMPLQQTFSSLSSYLGKLDDAIVAAAASGVSSIAAGAGISVSAGTGDVTVANTGVTSITGTANQITASASTGAVTLSVPQNFILSGTLPKLELRETTNIANVDIFLGQNGTDGEGLRIRYESGTGHSYLNNIYNIGNLVFQTNSITSFIIDASGNVIHKRNASGYWQESTGTWSGDPGSGIGKFEYHSNRWYIGAGSNSTELLRIRRGGVDEVSIDNDGTVRAYGYCGNENVGGTGAAAWFPSGLYSSSGATAWIYGTKNFGYGSIYAEGYHWSNGPTGLTDANAISCSNWFRSTGGSGWYNATYTGGIWMSDSTWIRTYNSKNFYCDQEIRVGGVLSSNSGRSRGSYGAISIGGNGRTNTWDGIEFADPQTLMIQGDQYSGVYRNNNTWNWLFSYSGLIIGSDERYKREIQPLNLGLNFIELLQPISYLKLTETPDDDPEATEPDYYYGFSAQNVRAALDAVGETRDVKIHNVGGPNMGSVACTEDAVYDRQYIGINEFIAPMVQAIKELSARVAELEKSTV